MKVDKGVDLKYSHHTQKNSNYVMMVLTNAMMVIILQNITVSNQSNVYLKLT